MRVAQRPSSARWSPAWRVANVRACSIGVPWWKKRPSRSRRSPLDSRSLRSSSSSTAPIVGLEPERKLEAGHLFAHGARIAPGRREQRPDGESARRLLVGKRGDVDRGCDDLRYEKAQRGAGEIHHVIVVVVGHDHGAEKKSGEAHPEMDADA